MQTVTVTLTREQFENKRTIAAEQGFTIQGDIGEQTDRGVKYMYLYKEEMSTLEITIEHVSIADRLAGYSEEKVATMLRQLLQQTV